MYERKNTNKMDKSTFDYDGCITCAFQCLGCLASCYALCMEGCGLSCSGHCNTNCADYCQAGPGMQFFDIKQL